MLLNPDCCTGICDILSPAHFKPVGPNKNIQKCQMWTIHIYCSYFVRDCLDPSTKVAITFRSSWQAVTIKIFLFIPSKSCIINLGCLHGDIKLARLTLTIKAVRTNLSGLVLYHHRLLQMIDFLLFITSFSTTLNYCLTSTTCNAPAVWGLGELVVMVSHQSCWRPAWQKKTQGYNWIIPDFPCSCKWRTHWEHSFCSCYSNKGGSMRQPL